jgi:1,5-anhydro-D-fructose reductase (1,5-anhydro-D-mannitol-forming)
VSETTLSWGLIGASDIAATRMIPALRRRGDAIVAVVSGDKDRATAFAAENGISLGSTDHNAALTHDVDAVYISNKNGQHFESALRAIVAGKHVLCEKPLALSVNEAQHLVDAATAAGVTFAVNHHLPGSGLHATTRRLVHEGAIGRVLSARVHHAVQLPERLRGWRIENVPGAGVVLDITCHDASVLNPLLGTPVRVSAIGVTQAEWDTGDSVDAVMTVIEYRGPNGEKIIAQTHDAFTVAYSPTALEVQGTRGSIRVLDAMTQDPTGTLLLTDVDGEREIELDSTEDLYTIILDNFHAAVDGTGSPTATGQDGTLAVAVALAVEESIRTASTVQLA